MSVNIKQIKYNISPSQYFTAMYQSSLPEGNVDCTRIVQNFTGQMKSHQDLCTAKDCNDNLRRRRGRMDGTDSRITVCSGSLSLCVCMYLLLVLPQDFWALFGGSDAGACWTSEPAGLPPDSHLFLSLSLHPWTRCPPLPVTWEEKNKNE